MAGDSPGLLGEIGLGFRELDRLQHLAQHAVGKDHDGHAVLVRQIERAVDVVGHLLHGRGGQDDDVEVTVPQRTRCLPVVRLRGLDATQAGTAALDVDDDARQIGARHVRDALALQRDAGRARGRHRPSTRSRCAVHHVNGGYLRLCLEVGAALLDHALRHVRSKFCLRGDWVPKEAAASCPNCGLSQCLVTFH